MRIIFCIFILALVTAAKNSRLLVLWDENTRPMSQLDQETLWATAFEKEVSLYHPDSLKIWQKTIQDSVDRDPNSLRRLAFKQLKMDGVLKLRLTQPVWKAKRWIWFPLISKNIQSQSWAVDYWNAKGEQKTWFIQLGDTTWGAWCGLHPCKITSTETREIHTQESNLSQKILLQILTRIK